MTELPEDAGTASTIGPGTHLREWEVIRPRGRGSYGTVFEARRSSWLDEPARALKVFDPMVSSRARHSLLEEFSVLTDLHHPHLLAGIDAFDLETPPFEGCVVFVLELADEDLAGHIARSGPLESAQVAGIGAQLAAGLHALHDRGRVHGDVKPENILRVGDRWVLGDFGVTGLLEGSYAVTPGTTIDYRPPELATAAPGSRLHRSTDVWALGVSLHVAATGRHPFPGPDPLLRYAAVVRGDRAPAPDLDPQLGTIIDSACLAPEPRSRASAAVLHDHLQAISPDAMSPDAMSPVATSSDTAPRPPPPQMSAEPTRSVLAHAAGTAAVVVATALICQLVALVAGELPYDLAVRRALYVAVSAPLAAGVVPLGHWLGRRHPWSRPQLRPLAYSAVVTTWLGTTALLFGII